MKAGEAATDSASSARASRRVVLGVACATALAFATSLGAGFVWDDALLIAHNRMLVGHGAVARALTHGFWDVETTGHDDPIAVYWRPAVTLLFVALRAVAGVRPLPYHATLIALHVAAVALAGKLARRLFDDDPRATFVAVAAFALHATRSQSVTWVVGATDVLASIPMLAALITVLPITHDERPRRAAIRGVPAALLCALALCAKESALVLPALLAVAYAARGSALDAVAPSSRLRGALAVAAPSALVVLLYLALRAAYLPFVAALGSPPFARHALLVGETVGRYGAIVVWPFPLTFFRTVLTIDDAGQLRTNAAWALAGVLVAALYAYALARAFATRRAVAWAGLLLALGLMAPVLNVRWAGFKDLVADRFLYLPMLGLGLALGDWSRAWSARARRTVALATAGLALAHGAAIAIRALDFQSERTLWQSEDELHPGVPAILVHVAGGQIEDGRYGAALVSLREAFERSSRYVLEARVANDMYQAFDVALLVVPDDDRASLEGALAFARALEDPRVPAARAVVLGYRFVLEKRGLGAWLARDAPRFAMTEATVLSRLGREDEATAAADRAVNACRASCLALVLNASLVHARARDWDRATRLASSARALDLTDASALQLSQRIALARAHADGAALDEAEVDVFLADPESARRRLADAPASPRADLLRARVALMEFRFDDAAALLGPLRATAPPSAAPEFAALAALEAAQRRKVAAPER